MAKLTAAEAAVTGHKLRPATGSIRSKAGSALSCCFPKGAVAVFLLDTKRAAREQKPPGEAKKRCGAKKLE
jgi:hypothetical protein